MLNSEKLKVFLLKQGCLFLPLLFNIIPEILVRAIRDEREMASKSEKKELKLPLFADDMVSYIEKIPKYSIKSVRIDKCF